ncbi:MAG: UMP kinase [Spirochaetota bacterium]
MTEVTVISLGGSIVAPDRVDVLFLRQFKTIVDDYLEKDAGRKLILVVGGGGPARLYQKAYREIAEKPEVETEDWIGIAATRLNAQLLFSIFKEYSREEIVTDPTSVEVFTGRLLVAAGWKPGFSTDYDAVLLAERFNARIVVNLSNIAQVYSADPKSDPAARPIDKISWKEFQSIVGDKWIPGKNVPFDPIATKQAARINLTVIVAAGKNIDNIKAILEGRDFEGTVIGPQ